MKTTIQYFQRKRRSNQNYSLEQIFEDLRNRLPEDFESKVKISKYHSNGFFPRIYNMLEAVFNQKDINHITGDITYQGILLRKSKTIQTILDCRFMENPSAFKRFFLKLFWLYLPVYRAKLVTVISYATKEQVIKFTGAPSSKIVVVPVAISTFFQPSPKSFNSDYPTLLQVGTATNKNLNRLIEAIKDIPCRLEIIGKLTPETTNKLKTYQIDYTNSFNISQEKVVQKYIESDIVTFVSTYEGFGMPILEANAVGRPVITGNLLSMPEVAGKAACLVDPFSVSEIRKGILKIIEDTNYRDQLINEGFENVKRYSPEGIANQYVKIYKQILKV